MTPHELSIRSVGGVCVIALEQDVDTAVAGRIEAEIVARTAPSVPVVVDLTAVGFLDSAGVRLMDRLVGRHRRAGGTAVIVAPDHGAPWFTLRMCEFPAGHLAASVHDAVARASAVPAAAPAQLAGGAQPAAVPPGAGDQHS
jgi:anti-anti-sigma factor